METDDQAQGQTAPEQRRAPQLSAIELRVLGALMEKQLTTPDAYPLSVNSIMTACNQKSSRDPISHYELGELKRALQMLEDKKFVHREYGSRAEKYSQHFIKFLELGKKQQALLCVMMLRGPQTLSELDTRTQRMCDFTDRGELEHSIDRLCNRDVPYAINLGQQSGQRGERITHLFTGTPVAGAREEGASSTSAPSSQVYSGTASFPSKTDASDTVEQLTIKAENLQAKIQLLESETSEIKKQLAELYQLTGHDASDKS